jgi:hypothetical protein
MTKRSSKAQTPRQQLAAMRRDAERDYLRGQRDKVKGLRGDVARAQRLRRDLISEAKALCEIAARRLQKIHAARRAQFERELAIEVDAGATQCRSATERAKQRGLDLRNQAQRALHSERADQRTEALYTGRRKLDRRPSGDGRRAAAITRAERAREVEDEAERNIDAELLPIWRKMKNKIVPSSRMSRTEAFMHWVHDHQGEVYRILEEQAQADAARMQRRPEDDEDLTEAERADRWERQREFGDDDDLGDDEGEPGGGDAPF